MYRIEVTVGFHKEPRIIETGTSQSALEQYGILLDKIERSGEPAVLVLTDPDGNEITSDIL